MLLIQELPTGLGVRHLKYQRALSHAATSGDLLAAVQAARSDYELLNTAQPDGRRYHKGWSLHNMGLFKLLTGDGDGGHRDTIRAFVEDAISLAEEERQTLYELHRPAAHNLVYVYGLPGPLIAMVSREVRRLVQAGNLYQAPEAVFDEPVVKRLLSTAPETLGKRIPGLFNSSPQDRVFVGGFYGSGLLDSVLRPICERLRVRHRDGVLADDFVVPAGMGIDEHALMLMYNCHCAVFDFTERGGQEQEFAALPDTMRERTLVVYDSRVASAPRVSGGMTKAKMDRWGIEARPFDSLGRLTEILDAFLDELG